jgi:hypothetical protein
MSAQEFKPGDRVRTEELRLGTVLAESDTRVRAARETHRAVCTSRQALPARALGRRQVTLTYARVLQRVHGMPQPAQSVLPDPGPWPEPSAGPDHG